MEASITYSVTTEESSAEGEHAAHGWWLPGGQEYPLADEQGQHEDVLEEAKRGVFRLPLKEAIQNALELGCHLGSLCGTAISVQSTEPPCDRDFIEDGESREYTLHLDAKTPLRTRLLRSYLTSKGVKFL